MEGSLGSHILTDVMSAFFLNRMRTPKLQVDGSRRRSRVPRNVKGNAKVTDWSAKKASLIGNIALGMIIALWFSVFTGMIGILPFGFVWVGLGLFVLTHLLLLIGEIVILREIPQRRQIIGGLWLPILICGAVGAVVLFFR